MYDLIIVGGGPGGSSAGRRAALRGLSTLVIEQDTFPRYKPCGGAVSKEALSFLDFILPASVSEREVFGLRLRYKESSLEGYKPYPIATMVTRSIFDGYLLEKGRDAGMEIRFSEKVVDYREKIDCVEVYTDGGLYRARFLIIGEGSQGKLKNRIRKGDAKGEYGICIVTEVEEDPHLIDDCMPRVLEIHFDVTTRGYGWIFPHHNYYSVGIGAFADKISDPKRVMKDFLQRNGFHGTYRLRGHIIPAGGIRRTIVGRRVILIGDAAGFVDPFAGEGIAYAIRSGQIAAETVWEVLHNKDGGHDLRKYEMTCQKEFLQRFKYAIFAAKLMHKYPDVFFGILTANREALDKFMDIPDLRRHYQSYLQWLLLRLPKYILSTTAARH